MFTDVIYTNITYFKLQVSVPLSLIYHLWSYNNNSAITRHIRKQLFLFQTHSK